MVCGSIEFNIGGTEAETNSVTRDRAKAVRLYSEWVWILKRKKMLFSVWQ